jgi:hypothetical protein
MSESIIKQAQDISVIFIRHSERADKVPCNTEVENKQDPPITENGFNIAQ